ncbi:MAG: hypothetical protein IJ566_06050 [Cardiobacteriaceae bacterium]|nr:hypothetical protein [Cardiobacteriaceae bacterium]
MRTIKLFIFLIVLCSSYSFADELKEVLEIRKQYQEAKKLVKNTKNKKFTSSYKNSIKDKDYGQLNLKVERQFFYNKDNLFVLMTSNATGGIDGTIYHEDLFDKETGRLIFVFETVEGSEYRCYFDNDEIVHIKSNSQTDDLEEICKEWQKEAIARKEALEYFN